MSNSIFKEISLTPHFFRKSSLLKDERMFERLLGFLDSLAENGQIVAPYINWFENINTFLIEFNEEDRDEIEEVLKYLSSRQRIVFSTENKSGNNEENWIEKCISFQKIRRLDLLLASVEYKEDTKTINRLDRNLLRNLQNGGAAIVPQSKENMQSLLAPILSYADIVKVFDPYFDLTKPRYSNALEVINSLLGLRHGEQEWKIIEIHTSVKVLLDRTASVDFSLLKKFVDFLNAIKKIYGHDLKIFIWEETENYKWHDRWIITNQCGVSIGKGSDISEWTDSTWGLLDYNELPNVEKKFSMNRSELRLIAIIENGSYQLKNRSITYTTAISEEQRLEKLKNVRSFKK